MNKFENMILRRIFRKEVKQGPQHTKNIERLYKMIREACEQEFTEDNSLTLNAFLSECFQNSH